MDARSESSLEDVHPDLVRILRAAAARSGDPFIVIHGLRTPEEERELVGKGASRTLHSRHLPGRDGLACAVDVAALVHGHVSWQAAPYGRIAEAVKAAAHELGLPIEWGGDWRTLKDLGHFQLPWSRYP